MATKLIIFFNNKKQQNMEQLRAGQTRQARLTLYDDVTNQPVSGQIWYADTQIQSTANHIVEATPTDDMFFFNFQGKDPGQATITITTLVHYTNSEGGVVDEEKSVSIDFTVSNSNATSLRLEFQN